MRPRVRPDMIPAKRTRKQERPAYMNHHADPNAMPPTDSDSRFRVSIRVASKAFIRCIAALTTLYVELSLLLLRPSFFDSWEMNLLLVRE